LFTNLQQFVLKKFFRQNVVILKNPKAIQKIFNHAYQETTFATFFQTIRMKPEELL